MKFKQVHFSFLIVLAYLVVGFVPYFGAIDKNSTQFLYLSGINTISLIFCLVNLNSFKKYIGRTLNTKVFILYFL